MTYILSKYTYLFSNENTYFLFNSRNTIFVEISREIYDQLSLSSIDLNDFSDIDFLLNNNIIIESEVIDEDYYYEEKVKSFQRFYSSTSLSLTLIPYSGCNFACPYCYEKKKPEIFMSNKTVDNLISFIREFKDAKQLNITWYGGEPLIGFEIIKDILARINSELDLKIGHHSIITNGYLLSPEIIDYFQCNELDSIQITIDGKEESHNKTRRLKKDGLPTYQTIVNNIEYIINKWPSTKINIRINIDISNKDEFIFVYKELTQRFGKDRLYIYPGFIRRENKEGNDLACDDLMKSQQQDFFLNLKDEDVDVRFYPKQPHKGCMANHINSYVVGPIGEMYKCWNDVGDKTKIIGYIDQNKINNKLLFVRYMSDLSCFEDDKCKDCFFFPMCPGGCSWYRLKNKFENGKFDICAIQKGEDVLKKYLLAHYKQLLEKKETGRNAIFV